jgi:hypothetical protein
MRLLLFAGALAFAIGVMPPLAAAGTLQISPEMAGEINVTSDSAPGWTPTAEQRQRAIEGVQHYLDAIERQSYAEAYRLYHPSLKLEVTLAQFTQDEKEFEDKAGSVKFWRVLKVTWTKDPAQATSPGIYVAVDLTGQFANVDRDCGYIVLYQPGLGGDFTIVHLENNYMDNASARQKSKVEVAKMWAELSRYCPNYVPQPETP